LKKVFIGLLEKLVDTFRNKTSFNASYHHFSLIGHPNISCYPVSMAIKGDGGIFENWHKFQNLPLFFPLAKVKWTGQGSKLPNVGIDAPTPAPLSQANSRTNLHQILYRPPHQLGEGS